MKNAGRMMGAAALFMAGAAMAELPTTTKAPSGEKYSSGGALVGAKIPKGDVVEVEFDQVQNLRLWKPGVFGCHLYLSTRDSFSKNPMIQFPEDGIGYFLKHSAQSEGQRVFVLVSGGFLGYSALGDQFSANEDGTGTYSWSVKTEIPNFDEDRVWTIDEVHLFRDKLLGKSIKVEFSYAWLFCSGLGGERNRGCRIHTERGARNAIYVFYSREMKKALEEAEKARNTYVLTGRLGLLNELSLSSGQLAELGIGVSGPNATLSDRELRLDVETVEKQKSKKSE